MRSVVNCETKNKYAVNFGVVLGIHQHLHLQNKTLRFLTDADTSSKSTDFWWRISITVSMSGYWARSIASGITFWWVSLLQCLNAFREGAITMSSGVIPCDYTTGKAICPNIQSGLFFIQFHRMTPCTGGCMKPLETADFCQPCQCHSISYINLNNISPDFSVFKCWQI